VPSSSKLTVANASSHSDPSQEPVIALQLVLSKNVCHPYLTQEELELVELELVELELELEDDLLELDELEELDRELELLLELAAAINRMSSTVVVAHELVEDDELELDDLLELEEDELATSVIATAIPAAWSDVPQSI